MARPPGKKKKQKSVEYPVETPAFGGDELEHVTERENPAKTHKIEQTEAAVSQGSDPQTKKGESAVTAGLLGLGKLISSNTSGGSDKFLVGVPITRGRNSSKPIEDDHTAHK